MSAPPAVAVSNGVVPAKIVMKGTSRMSLNDRFSVISAKVEEQQKVTAHLSFESNGVPQFVNDRVSSANRRLARQMEGRPAVRAALRLKQKSVKQRLGAKARLGGYVPNHYNNNGTSNGFTRLPIYGYNKFGNLRGRSRMYQRYNQMKKRFDLMSDLDTFVFNSLPPVRQRFNNYRGRFGYGGGNFRRRNRGSGGPGRVGFRFKSRGRGGQFRQPASNRFSQDELDKELDEYMAKTKTQLDTELESYMADANVIV